MSTIAYTADYHGEMKDSLDKFHGQQILNVGWDRHTMYAAPVCIPVPPQMPFGALIEQVMPGLFGAHPDFARIDWAQVTWLNCGQAFTPDAAKSLADNGLVHKAVLRFQTPALTGLKGTHN